MQRWIAVSLVLLGLLVLGGGGLYAVWQHKQNQPYPIWVPLPVNAEVTIQKRAEIVKELQARLSDQELLAEVSKDMGLAAKWHLASDQEAAKDLAQRLFVRASTTTIDIGLKGTKKEKKVIGETVTRLMKDVGRILGLELPPKS